MIGLSITNTLSLLAIESEWTQECQDWQIFGMQFGDQWQLFTGSAGVSPAARRRRAFIEIVLHNLFALRAHCGRDARAPSKL